VIIYLLFNAKKAEVIKMPGGDGTGPTGQGPITGRGLGFCGRGMRRVYTRGFGRRSFNRRMFQPTNKEDLEQELNYISEKENLLREEKETIRKRIEEMK